MSLSIVSLLLLAAGSALPPDLEFVTPEQAVASLHQCGFSDVASRYEDELQDNVLTIADASATGAQIECAARVHVTSGYWTEVPEAYRSQYLEQYNRLSAERSRQWALRELDARGELERLPVYEAGKTSDVEFARQLEKLCGGRAKGMLQSEHGPHTISPAWASARRDFHQTAEAVGCVMRFSAAAGFDLGFIGNGKSAASPDSQ